MNSRIIYVLLALAGLALIWQSFVWDAPSREVIREMQGPRWKKSSARHFHSKVRRYGDWPYLMLAGGAGLGVAALLRSRKWQRILIAAMLASTLAGIAVNLSRLTTGRTRPSVNEKIEQGFYGPWSHGRLTIGDPAYNSFPSGHTATAFGFAGVILFAAPVAGIFAMAAAALIAFSSLMMDAHHLSDVVTSILIAMAVAWFLWRWMVQSGDATWQQLRKKFHHWRERAGNKQPPSKTS